MLVEEAERGKTIACLICKAPIPVPPPGAPAPAVLLDPPAAPVPVAKRLPRPS
jgi:hypothetical protein